MGMILYLHHKNFRVKRGSLEISKRVTTLKGGMSYVNLKVLTDSHTTFSVDLNETSESNDSDEDEGMRARITKKRQFPSSLLDISDEKKLIQINQKAVRTSQPLKLKRLSSQ